MHAWVREICRERQWIGSLHTQIIAVYWCAHLGYSVSACDSNKDGISTEMETHALYLNNLITSPLPLHFASIHYTHPLRLPLFFFSSSSCQHRLVEKLYIVLSCPFKDRRWKKTSGTRREGDFLFSSFFFSLYKISNSFFFSRLLFLFLYPTLFKHTQDGTAKPEHTVWQKDAKQAWLCGKVFSGDSHQKCRLHHQALLVSKEASSLFVCAMITAV